MKMTIKTRKATFEAQVDSLAPGEREKVIDNCLWNTDAFVAWFNERFGHSIDPAEVIMTTVG